MVEGVDKWNPGDVLLKLDDAGHYFGAVKEGEEHHREDKGYAGSQQGGIFYLSRGEALDQGDNERPQCRQEDYQCQIGKFQNALPPLAN
jgi:hypothetical protein